MSHYLEEAMGVNHAAQQEHRQWLENAAAGGGSDALYDYAGSDEFAHSLDGEHGDNSGGGQSDRGSSRGSMQLSDDAGEPLLPPLISSRRLEPSAQQQSSLRRENEVPLTFMGEASTSSRYEAMHRAGIHPEARAVPDGYWEARNLARQELRPLTRQARAIGSAREAAEMAHRGPLRSTSRWGRFKDRLRGFAFMRRLGMSSHAQVQARRRERLINRRAEASRSTSRFAALAAKGTSAFEPGTAFNQRWGGLEPTAGGVIPEVDSEDEAE